MVVAECAVNAAESLWERVGCPNLGGGGRRVGYYDHKGTAILFVAGHGAHAWADGIEGALHQTGETRKIWLPDVSGGLGDYRERPDEVEAAVFSTTIDIFCVRSQGDPDDAMCEICDPGGELHKRDIEDRNRRARDEAAGMEPVF